MIQVPSNATFVFLRKKVMDAFSLYQCDFDMNLYKSSSTLTFDHEEDYSVLALGKNIYFFYKNC